MIKKATLLVAVLMVMPTFGHSMIKNFKDYVKEKISRFPFSDPSYVDEYRINFFIDGIKKKGKAFRDIYRYKDVFEYTLNLSKDGKSAILEVLDTNEEVTEDTLDQIRSIIGQEASWMFFENDAIQMKMLYALTAFVLVYESLEIGFCIAKIIDLVF